MKTIIIVVIIIIVAAVGISVGWYLISDMSGKISTALALIIGAAITGIIYYNQERGQEQMREALINIDLLSNGALDRKNISQRSFLYETYFGFVDLLSTNNKSQFDSTLGKLKKFVENNYFDFSIKENAQQLLFEFERKSHFFILLNSYDEYLKEKLKRYKLIIDTHLNDNVEEITSSSDQNTKKKEWIIVVGF